MRKIEAIVRPERFPQVEQELKRMGIGGMTYFPVKGFGSQRTPGSDDVDKVKIEIFVDEFQVDKVVEIMMRSAATGQPGDGKIAISTIDTIYRIRTKEEGTRAL